MKLTDLSLAKKYRYRKKLFLLPKTKATAAKLHFYKKINFLKKKKILKTSIPSPNCRKKQLSFLKKTSICVIKPTYINKTLSTQLI